MSQQVSVPLLITLEFARATQAGDPHAFRFEPQQYLLRSAGGGFESAEFPWERALLEDLQTLSRPARDSALLQRIGERLQKFLGPTGWNEHEVRVLEALRSHQRVLITIRSAAAELYALPWELVTLKSTGQHLGELPGVSVRYEWPETQSAPADGVAGEGGRVLLAWSAAAGAVPAAEHVAAISAAWQGGHLDFDAQRDVLPNSSAAAIVKALERARGEGRPVEVLHLLCHGQASGGSFGLALDGATSAEAALVEAGTLRQLLAPFAGTLRLVVLCACNSGNSGPLGSQLGSVAQTLHRAGLPAVVASRLPLSVDGSVRLTEVLYSQLLCELTSLEDALALARRRLAEDTRSLDWAAVQLYGRAADGEDTRPVVIRPYRGLLAFGPEHARFYHGRQREIDAVLRKLAALRKGGKPRLIVISGASGTGKSSIVPAGVLPQLARGPEKWGFASMRVSASPAKTLEELLHRRNDTKTNLLLMVDQFEELFTHGGSLAERTAFVQRLWRVAADADSAVTVMITVRVDYVGSCGELVLDNSGLRLDRVAYDDAHGLFLAQSTTEQLRCSISEPAQKVGLWLEDGLEQRLLDAVGAEPGALPLLEYTLDRLWEQRHGRLLTQRAYDDMGGVSGALNSRADALLAQFSATQQQVARRLLVRLVDAGEGTRPATRRRGVVSALRPSDAAMAALFDDVLMALVDARLLVRDRQGDKELVEVAHEALIRRWQQLRDWVMADRAMLAELEKVEAWAEACDNYKTVLTGNQLGYAEDVERNYGGELSARARALLLRSHAEQRRLQRARQRTLAGLLALSMAAVAAAGLASWQTGVANKRRDQAIKVASQIIMVSQGRLKNLAGGTDVQRELLALVDELPVAWQDGAGETGLAGSIQRRRLTEEADLILRNPRAGEQRLVDAARRYRQAMTLAESELRNNPDDPGLRDELSLSLERLGSVLMMSGKLQEARQHYERSLELTQGSAAKEPGNMRRQRDLADTHASLGDVFKTAGKLPEAEAHYRQALAIRLKMAETDPKQAQWQLDLAASYDQLGDVAKALSKLPEARQSYERGLQIVKALADSDRTNTLWQRNLTLAYIKLGEIWKAQGSLAEAQNYYNMAVQKAGRLVERDRGNIQAQIDLAAAHSGAGDVLDAQGKREEAQTHYEQSMQLVTMLVGSDPTNADWQRELAVSYVKLGCGRLPAQDYEGALQYYEKALALTQKLTDNDPSNSAWQLDLLNVHRLLLFWSYSAHRDEHAHIHRAAVVALLDRFDRQNLFSKDPIVAQARELLKQSPQAQESPR